MQLDPAGNPKARHSDWISTRIEAVPFWRSVSTAVLILLVGARAPELLIEPRFWAEEATVFYAAAMSVPFLDALTHIPTGTAGYLLLSASIPATIAAAWFPIGFAPAVTTASALLVQMIVFALILWGRSLIWQSPASKLVACGIILFAPSATGEVWLNSINSQVYCGLISLILLCEDTESWSPRRFGIMLGLLTGCALSGVYSAFLFPAFLYRWSWDRTRAQTRLVLVIGLCSCIQLAVFTHLAIGGEIAESKFQGFDLFRSVGFMVFGQVLEPLGLGELARWGGRAFGLARINPLREIGWLALPLLIGSTIAGVSMLERRYRSPANLLAFAFGCLAVLTMVSATRGEAAGRYAVLPGFTLLFFLLAHATQVETTLRKRVAIGLISLSMLVGIASYRDQEEFQCAFGCPSWSNEVERWSQEPGYYPQVWPGVFPRSGAQWRVRVDWPGAKPTLTGGSDR